MPFNLVFLRILKITHSRIVKQSSDHFRLINQLDLLSCLFVPIFGTFNLINGFLQGPLSEKDDSLFI